MPRNNNNISLLLADLEDYSAQKTIIDLIESGIDVNFINPMLDIFKQYVLTGGNYSDLVDELQVYIKGSENKLGVLERYTKQVTSDALTQYNANYNQVLSEDLGLQFYKIVGNRQDDSRCFCIERVNKFYHKKEIEDWGEGKNIGACYVLNANGTKWKGAYIGTNKSTIFTYRGGYNCEHQYIAVSDGQVPKDVILRNIKNGNYIPSDYIKNKFEL